MALQQHTRSHSFPSGSSSSQQDAMFQVDESFLRESTPPSLSSATNRVNGLQKLHESINDLLLLPHIRRAIARECPQQRCVDDIMAGYVAALVACAAAGDLVSAAKRDAQELLSGVRRRHAGAAASSYLASRRELRKMARTQKWLFKKIGKRQSWGKGYEIEQLLMDAKTATLTTLGCVFSYVVSRRKLLVGSKRAEETEFSKVDAALISFMNNGDDDVIRDDHHHLLRGLESSIRVVEEGLECLFRQLIKTRVLLLNILSQ